MDGTILMMSGDTPRRTATKAGLRRAAEMGHHDPEAVEAVLHDTWGHLKAVPGRDYEGHIVFAHTCHGELTILDWSFGDLSGGPWLPHEMMDFISSKVPIDTDGFRLWCFRGVFRELKNGKGRFRGTIRPQRVVDRFPSGKRARTKEAEQSRTRFAA